MSVTLTRVLAQEKQIGFQFSMPQAEKRQSVQLAPELSQIEKSGKRGIAEP